LAGLAFGQWASGGRARAGQAASGHFGALRSRLYVNVRSDPDQISEAAVSQAGLTILDITQIAANPNQHPHIKGVSAPPVW
jgi:hypothetical protein